MCINLLRIITPSLVIMSVHLVRTVRLTVGAGAAKPGPGIGQALGPLGLNMAEFCKQFNEVSHIVIQSRCYSWIFHSFLDLHEQGMTNPHKYSLLHFS